IANRHCVNHASRATCGARRPAPSSGQARGPKIGSSAPENRCAQRKRDAVLRSPPPKLTPDETVESRSASAIVTDALREGILHGTLPAGERLRQDAIATRFGVSQMIVREAFKQLVTE